MGYLYGGNTGIKSAAELQRERDIVDALIARGQRPPQNLGEGLSTLGQAIASRIRRKRLEGDEGAAKEAGSSMLAELFPQPDSPTITPQSEIQTGPLGGGMSTYQPEPSLAGSPYPINGPETPPGPADWQQGEAMPAPEPMSSPAPFPKTENTLEHMSADQLTRFMADPRFEHMPPMVQQMVAEQFKRKSAPVDPMDALNVEKAQLEIDKLRNPPPEKPTDTMREFDLAIQNPAFKQYMLEMKRAGSSSINLGGGSDKQIFDTMNESAIAAQQATKGLIGIREARKALPGAILGAGADFRLGLQKIGALMGAADTNAIADTETFRAAIAPQVAAMLKSTVGSTQISNADREFAEKASGGSIKLDGASISRLLDIMERGNSDTVQRHIKRLNAVYPDTGDFQRERALFGVDALPPMPAPASSGPVQVQSVDDYNRLPPGTQYISPDGQLRVKR